MSHGSGHQRPSDKKVSPGEWSEALANSFNLAVVAPNDMGAPVAQAPCAAVFACATLAGWQGRPAEPAWWVDLALSQVRIWL